MVMRVWKYEQVDLREDVRLGLPDDWAAFIYKVTAGEEEGKRFSGQAWYCTILRNAKTDQTIEFCNCPEGWSRAPLAVLNAVPHLCKHTENLMEFLRQKGLKKGG